MEKKLRPPIALHGLRNRDEVAVKEYLSGWVLQAKDEEEAKNRLHNLLNFSLASAPTYPDVTAVHFADQLVANGYYGGESNNEVFFIYPADVLASQHDFTFNGWEKDFTKPQSETKWNDVFMWPSTLDNPGISIDAGIVFLPETTPVDPTTGSKYASELKVIEGKEKRVMIEDTALVNLFVKWGKELNEQSPVRQAFSVYKSERNYYYQQEKEQACLVVFSQELQHLGFTSDASIALSGKMMSELYWRTDFNDEALEMMVKGSGAHWKRAEVTVPAKKYWEDFFTQNPDLRPKHIQYYDGDPTSAVYEFQQKNNIGRANTSKTDGNLLGFDDHHVIDVGKDPRSNAGYDELVETSNKIIAEHYGDATVTKETEELPV